MLVTLKQNTKDLLTNKKINSNEKYLIMSPDKDYSLLINKNGIIKVNNANIKREMII